MRWYKFTHGRANPGGIRTYGRISPKMNIFGDVDVNHFWFKSHRSLLSDDPTSEEAKSQRDLIADPMRTAPPDLQSDN